MALTFTPIDDSNAPKQAGNLTFTPAGADEPSVKDIPSNFVNDAASDVKGLGKLAKGAFNVATGGPFRDTAMQLAVGMPFSQTPVVQNIKTMGELGLHAIPHTEDGKWVPGGILDTAGEYGGNKLIHGDVKGAIDDAANSFIKHPLNMPLDVLNAVAPVKGMLGAGAHAAEAASVLGKAANAAEKIGAVGDSGILRKFGSATSGAAEGAFHQLEKDPTLLKSAPKVDAATSMVHEAVNKDIPNMLSEPTAKLSQDAQKGLQAIKNSYFNAIDTHAKGVQGMLDSLKQNASDAEAAVRNKLGLGESLEQGQQRIINNGTGVPKAGQVLKEYGMLSKMNDTEPMKLKGLLDVRKNIDANLDYSQAGKSLEPLSTADEAILQKTRKDVTDAIHRLPGGMDIKAVDDQWHNALDVRRQLQSQFGTEDKASKAIEGIINNERPSKATVAGLQRLEELTKRPILQPLQETAKPLQDTIDALDSHLKTPEGAEKLIHKAAIGELPSMQANALNHVDQVMGTKIVPEAQKLQDLVTLKNKLQTARFAEPGATRETLMNAFNDPQSHEDLINHLSTLEKVTGKPIAETVNRALAGEQLRSPFNTSKSTMMLRVGAPLAAAQMNKLPLAGLITAAVSPRILAEGAKLTQKAGHAVQSATEAMHIGGLSAENIGQAGEAGNVADRVDEKPSLSKSLRTKR